MATVNSRELVDEIIAKGGHYDEDELIVRIVQYNNQFNGGIAYGLIYDGEDIWKYHNAPACHNPKIIFDYGLPINHG